MEAGSVEHSLEKFGCKGDMSGENMSRVFCSFHKLFVYVMKLIERIQEPEIENGGGGVGGGTDNGKFYVHTKDSWSRFKAGMEGLAFGRRHPRITRQNGWLFVGYWEKEAITVSTTSISLYSKSMRGSEENRVGFKSCL